MRRTRLLIPGVVLLFASVFAVILLYLTINSPRRDFERFLKQVATVEIGKTTLEDWREQMARAQISSLASYCKQLDCASGIRTENKLLYKLRLAPRSIVDASVGFKNGLASEIYIIFEIAEKNETGEWHDGKGVVVRQSTDRPTPCHPHYDLSMKPRAGSGERLWASVGMDPCVLPEERAKALAINTACLTRLGGCKTVEAILPQVFPRP
jgi:hypothetical protein